MAHATHRITEEILRHVHANPRAIARLAVGIDRAAMEHGLQRPDRHLHNLAARRAVYLRNKPDTARVTLVGRVVGVGVDERTALTRVALQPFLTFSFMCHQNLSWPC